jgi:hypothetical protein
MRFMRDVGGLLSPPISEHTRTCAAQKEEPRERHEGNEIPASPANRLQSGEREAKFRTRL